MNLQQLHYVLATFEHGSFSAAAEVLHLAQPSLSEQVRRLEAELGVALFQRIGRGLVPTEAGRALRPHAEAALAAVEAARSSVGAVRELRAGTAAFGTFGTARTYLGTDLVEDFRRSYPGVRVRIVGQNSSETVEAIRDGELEAGLVVLPVDDRGLEIRPAMRDEVLYVSADPARVQRAMSIERLARAPLILSEASWGSEDPTRRQLSELSQRAGVTIEPQIDVEDVEVALELAARGLGDTIAPAGMLRRLAPSALGWVPFADPIYETFAFTWRRGAELSPATTAFMTFAERRLELLADALRTEPPRRRAPAGGGRARARRRDADAPG
ncbi:MAG TPA: LysR family transcriptional regulator [Solirubrobacteraceae bacterium]|nr:LysR family transcriptional regulator [Solirubrobacteraceae bacterium]